MSTLIQTTLVITILSASLFGIFVHAKRTHTFQHNLLIVHFFSIAIWAFSTLLVLQKEIEFAVELAFASAIILAVSKFYFIVTFPDGKIASKTLSYTPFILAAFLFVLAFVKDSYFTGFSVVDGYYVTIENGRFATLYMLIISMLLIYPIVNLYRKLRSGLYTGHLNSQIRLLLWGVTAFFVLGLVTNSILPVVFDIHYLNGLGPSFSLILAGFILYIISKYHFLGLSVFVQRGLIYSILFSGITSVYLTTLFLFEVFFHLPPTVNPGLSGLITSLIAIMSVPSLDKYLRSKTDRFFYRDTYNYSDAMQQISQVLSLSIKIDEIQQKTQHFLEKTLKASATDFSIYDKPKPLPGDSPRLLSSDQFGVTIPLMSGEKYIGKMSMKKKLSGDPYTISDLQLLKTLSYHLAVAFERALLHKELEDYSRQLEERVTKRTTELQAAYDDQRLMISNIAHGLQTPLVIIEGELEELSTGKLSHDRILTLQHSLSSISNFITDLLRLARLESESELMNLKRCDIGLLLEEIISYVDVLAAESGVKLSYTGPSDVHISCEQKRLEEAFLALISNALKYRHPHRDTEIIIRLSATESKVIILISDTGMGIPEDSLAKIFNRFYRVQNKFTANIYGSGLGLPIAQAIIHKHGGEISVVSKLDIGTTFTIVLPRHPDYNSGEL